MNCVTLTKSFSSFFIFFEKIERERHGLLSTPLLILTAQQTPTERSLIQIQEFTLRNTTPHIDLNRYKNDTQILI
jgi:hypothetical protein